MQKAGILFLLTSIETDNDIKHTNQNFPSFKLYLLHNLVMFLPESYPISLISKKTLNKIKF